MFYASSSYPLKKLSTLLLLLTAGGVGLPAMAETQPKLDVVAEWNRLPYDLSDPAAAAAWQKNDTKAMLHGVKVDAHGNLYVSTARWGGPEVPATLSKLVKKDGQWMLKPFPSEAMNDVHNPQGLKAVLGFEIDRHNVMWILDQGHIAGAPNKPGDEKLVAWDLNKNKEVARYTFTNDQVDFTCSFLNDVAVDNDTGVVYITDSGIMCHPLKGGLLVYKMKTGEAKRVLSAPEWVNDQPGFTFSIHGEKVLKDKDGKANPMLTGADGIALSGDKKTLYWTNLTGNRLMKVPTAVLRNFNNSEAQIEQAIKVDTVLPSNTDGITADRQGNLYLTALMLNGLMKRDVKTGKVTPLVTSDAIAWPDTIGWGPHGDLYFVSNHLNSWVGGEMNFTHPPVPNFRIYKVRVGGEPYTAK
ncbi:L-dopachrome tautomerase-related protein [Pantoea sp. App145]|uniref:L-dopachrome tautomerase-related protein n=1 Tax=Pantoea sp. App145 TaxID=3071567 RepID=UPI003A800A53